MIRKCVDCGKEFELTNGEVAFYEEKKFSLPKRCKECRDKKNQKEEKPQKVMEQQDQTKVKDGMVAKPTGTVMGRNGDKGGRKRNIFSILGAILALILGGTAYFGTQSTEDFGAVFDQISQVQEEYQAADEGGQIEESLFADAEDEKQAIEITYGFRKEQYLEEHFEKHGEEFPYATKEAYLEGANRVLASPDLLHKTEKEDGDDVYFLESTGELVIVSTDGYIRTYFKPEDGIRYFERQ